MTGRVEPTPVGAPQHVELAPARKPRESKENVSQQTAVRRDGGGSRPDGQEAARQDAASPSSVVVNEHDPMIGRSLEGRYTIVSKLGAGSMGTVYRAKQHTMGREVAIKILRSDRALDESAKARFLREARANSLLASPNTVTVFDFGQSKTGELYLAMELLDGESLGQRLTRVGRLAVDAAIDTARQALRSLGEAHAKGIVHRDLKPDNLFFAKVLSGALIGDDSRTTTRHEEIVKVVDFGIAKMLREGDGPMNVVETQAGTVFGTPRYMSPEQAQGKPLDARSDLYSLGVILYQMLTGRPPFTDDDAIVVMARHIKTPPKLPTEVCPEADIPKEVEAAVMRALAKDPSDRPENAEAMAAELLAAAEATLAGTSGVRAMLTNAAGIPVPDSMRPPAMSVPPPPVAPAVAASASSRDGRGMAWFVAIGLGVVGIGVAAYLIASSSPKATVVPPVPSASAKAPTTVKTAPAASHSGAPTISVDSLPLVGQKPTASAPATTSATVAPPPTMTPAAAPSTTAKKPAPTPPSKPSAAPAPSATSKYGTLDP